MACGFGFISVGRRWVAVVFAAVVGVLLLVSGVRGLVGTYELVGNSCLFLLRNCSFFRLLISWRCYCHCFLGSRFSVLVAPS